MSFYIQQYGHALIFNLELNIHFNIFEKKLSKVETRLIKLHFPSFFPQKTLILDVNIKI